jgi:hypothetical protein
MPTRFRSILYFRFTLSPADLELLAGGIVNIVQIVGAKFDGDFQFGGLGGGVWRKRHNFLLLRERRAYPKGGKTHRHQPMFITAFS